MAWGRETWVWSWASGREPEASPCASCLLLAAPGLHPPLLTRWTIEGWVSNAATALEREFLSVGKQHPALPVTDL